MGLLINDSMFNKCLRKLSYETQGLAEARLKTMRAGSKTHSPERLHTYLCEHCGTYHIGHITVRAAKREKYPLSPTG
jgi:hypothetical protein